MRACYTHIYYFNMNVERTSSDKEPLFISTREEIWAQHLHLLAHRSFLQMPQCCAIAVCIYCCDEVQELMKENALCIAQCHQEGHLHRRLRCHSCPPFTADLALSSFHFWGSVKKHFRINHFGQDEMKLWALISSLWESIMLCIAATDVSVGLAITQRNRSVHYSLLFWTLI
jgi:hypothetical protein